MVVEKRVCRAAQLGVPWLRPSRLPDALLSTVATVASSHRGPKRCASLPTRVAHKPRGPRRLRKALLPKGHTGTNLFKFPSNSV